MDDVVISLLRLLPLAILAACAYLAFRAQEGVKKRFAGWVQSQGGTIQSMTKRRSMSLRANVYTAVWTDAARRRRVHEFDQVTTPGHDFREITPGSSTGE